QGGSHRPASPGSRPAAAPEPQVHGSDFAVHRSAIGCHARVGGCARVARAATALATNPIDAEAALALQRLRTWRARTKPRCEDGRAQQARGSVRSVEPQLRGAAAI